MYVHIKECSHFFVRQASHKMEIYSHALTSAKEFKRFSQIATIFYLFIIKFLGLSDCHNILFKSHEWHFIKRTGRFDGFKAVKHDVL